MPFSWQNTGKFIRFRAKNGKKQVELIDYRASVDHNDLKKLAYLGGINLFVGEGNVIYTLGRIPLKNARRES